MTRVIGCGNLHRGDDAAGLLAARRLHELGVASAGCSGEALSLMDGWAGAESVILIDAVVSGQPPGTITVWDPLAAPLPRECFMGSTHAFGVAEAIELARVLRRLPPQLTLYGIEGARFDQGSPPSPEVLMAVERVAQEIAQCTNPRS
ncbi:MAG: hydrogenase maturation protease [Bryobacterales bacterium]|nr:hydrogenase maturation protease [Bryobacterales bacterium]